MADVCAHAAGAMANSLALADESPALVIGEDPPVTFLPWGGDNRTMDI